MGTNIDSWGTPSYLVSQKKYFKKTFSIVIFGPCFLYFKNENVWKCMKVYENVAASMDRPYT